MTNTFQWRRSVLICLCLAVVTAAVYWPVRHFEFTNYDYDLVERIRGAWAGWCSKRMACSRWQPQMAENSLRILV
ncbi:MAG: hypothetical protein ABSA97_10230 [Verrucomicrobiia bacterium]